MAIQDTTDSFATPLTAVGTSADSNVGQTRLDGSALVPAQPVSAQASTAPVAAPVAVDPRIAQLADAKTQLQTIQESLNAGLDTQGELAVGQMQEARDPWDDAQQKKEAQRAQLALHQTEIDATNQIYDEQLAQARLQGEGRLGSTRAIGARGGILGSDFASSQKQEQIGANNAQQRAIQAERQAKIGNIMGEVRSSVLADMEDRRQAYAMGADQVLGYIAGAGTRQEKNVNKFAQAALAQGIDITDLDEEELKEIAGRAGVTVADLTEGYYAAKKAQTVEEKDFTLSQGQQRFDSSGNIIASVDKTFAPTSGGGGSTASFTPTQRNKLEAAGLLEAPRQTQLDHLFGENSSGGFEPEEIDSYLSENRNNDPEALRRDLLENGMSVTLANSYLESRPLSSIDTSDFASALVSDEIEGSLFSSRGQELEDAKIAAIEKLQQEVNSGVSFDIFGERTKQISNAELNEIIENINKLSGRATAKELLGNK